MAAVFELPEQDITLYDFIFSHSAPADQSWFLDAATGESYTRCQVKNRTDALALGLQLHLDPKISLDASSPSVGPVVAIVSPNDIDYGIAVWACHRLGYTVAPSNAIATVDELVHQLRLTNASLIIAHPSTLERVLPAASQVGLPEDHLIVLSRDDSNTLPLATSKGLIQEGIEAFGRGESLKSLNPLPISGPRIAFLCFSSGTTGLPKAVIIPHRAVIANVLQVAHSGCLHPRSSDPTTQDRALGVIPVSHMYGLLTLLHLCPYLGITSTLFPSMPPFEEFLDLVQKWQINHLFLAPPLVNAFLKHPAAKGRDFTFFKTCLVAAAPLDGQSEQKFHDLVDASDFVISQAFGMTEAAGLITGPALGITPHRGSVGQLMQLTEAKVLNSPETTCHSGRIRGELLIRGPQLCLGYLNDESATREAFDSEGYVRTGDEVEMDNNGNIFIVDRLKSMIKCKGFQVSPSELEGHIRKHVFVKDVAVVGKPDERCGEVPVAFVVLSDVGLEELERAVDIQESIMQSVRASKSQYKWLAEVRLVDAIPKLASGKTHVRELKALFINGLARVAAASTHSFASSTSTLFRSQSPDSTAKAAASTVSASSSSSSRLTLVESRADDLSKVDLEKGIVNLETKAHLAVEERAKQFHEKKADAAATRLQRFREWLSLYRIIFFSLISLNIVGVVFTLAHKWDFASDNSATIALCFITGAILVRNELFVRCLYMILLFCFKRWTPLGFRNAISAFLLNIGGLHSGFSVSGTMWLVTSTIELFRSVAWSHPRSNADPWLCVLGLAVSLLIVSVCITAHPALRERHHNLFERIHRFAGWSALGLLWIFVGVADAWDREQHIFQPSRIKTKPDIYIAIVLTLIIFLPWMTLRKVPVKAEVLSNSVVLLRFEGYIGRGSLGRISRNPFSENHAFGITSKALEYQPEGGEHYMCVVGQGDFTRGLIANPPTHLWTRTMKFTGLPIMTSFYRSGLYVVTGSAIGVALSIFMQRDPRSRWHLLWVASNIEETYGTTVLPDLRQAFQKHDDGCTFENSVIIWDTRKQGRPDIPSLIETTVRENNCEVVFVTSNPKGTADTIRACTDRQIPCHGPIWDS